MMRLAAPAKPPSVNSRWTLSVSYGLAAWMTVTAVAQMVSFDEFVNAMRSYEVIGPGGGLVLAIVLLAVEVFSVAFLLRLSLRPIARAVSAVCAVLAPYMWAFLTFSALSGGQDISNAGYFGGFLPMPVGGLVVALNIIWILLVATSFGRLGGHQALRVKVTK